MDAIARYEKIQALKDRVEAGRMHCEFLAYELKVASKSTQKMDLADRLNRAMREMRAFEFTLGLLEKENSRGFASLSNS
jgi:hypothetical protein